MSGKVNPSIKVSLPRLKGHKNDKKNKTRVDAKKTGKVAGSIISQNKSDSTKNKTNGLPKKASSVIKPSPRITLLNVCDEYSKGKPFRLTDQVASLVFHRNSLSNTISVNGKGFTDVHARDLFSLVLEKKALDYIEVNSQKIFPLNSPGIAQAIEEARVNQYARLLGTTNSSRCELIRLNNAQQDQFEIRLYGQVNETFFKDLLSQLDEKRIQVSCIKKASSAGGELKPYFNLSYSQKMEGLTSKKVSNFHITCEKMEQLSALAPLFLKFDNSLNLYHRKIIRETNLNPIVIRRVSPESQKINLFLPEANITLEELLKLKTFLLEQGFEINHVQVSTFSQSDSFLKTYIYPYFETDGTQEQQNTFKFLLQALGIEEHSFIGQALKTKVKSDPNIANKLLDWQVNEEKRNRFLFNLGIDVLVSRLDANEHSFLYGAVLSGFLTSHNEDIFTDPQLCSLFTLLKTDISTLCAQQRESSLTESNVYYGITFEQLLKKIGIDDSLFYDLSFRQQLVNDLTQAQYHFSRTNSDGDWMSETRPLLISDNLLELSRSSMSPRELIELHLCHILKEQTKSLPIEEAFEFQQNLARAIALSVLTQSISSGERDCLGNTTIEYTKLLVESLGEHGVFEGLQAVKIGGLESMLASPGVFRGASLAVDELKALEVIRSALDLSVRSDEEACYTTQENIRIKKTIEELLLGQGTGNESLDLALNALGRIIQEKFFRQFKFEVCQREAWTGFCYEAKIFHFNTEKTTWETGLYKEVEKTLGGLIFDYPFVIRPEDFVDVQNFTIDNVGENYGVEGLSNDKLPMLGTVSRQRVLKSLQNHTLLNLISNASFTRYPLHPDLDINCAQLILPALGNLTLKVYELKDPNGKKLYYSDKLSSELSNFSEHIESLFLIAESISKLNEAQFGVFSDWVQHDLHLLRDNKSLDTDFEKTHLPFLQLSSEEKKGLKKVFGAFVKGCALLTASPLFHSARDYANLSLFLYQKVKNKPLSEEGRLQFVEYLQLLKENPEKVLILPLIEKTVDFRLFPEGELKDKLKSLSSKGSKLDLDNHLPLFSSWNIRGPLDSSSLGHIDFKTDKHCLYTSVLMAMIGIERGGKVRGTDMALSSNKSKNEKLIKQLRATVADYILKNHHNYLNYVDDNPNAKDAWCKISAMTAGQPIRKRKLAALKQKCDSIKTGEWASDIEIATLSAILGRTIILFREKKPDAGTGGAFSIHEAPLEINGFGKNKFQGKPVVLLYSQSHFRLVTSLAHLHALTDQGYYD